MSLVIHYWIGDVQDCQGVSASEMTYIVSSGALNSTDSLTCARCFFVYTYVIHLYIALYVHYCMIVYFPFLFSNFSFWVYTNCIHSLWALHLPGISLEYDILAHVARTFQQVYIRYILHITGIPTYHWINIMWMVLIGILVSLHFITVWLYPDVYHLLLHLYFVHRVHIVLTLSHWFYVYETYTSGILMVHISPQ